MKQSVRYFCLIIFIFFLFGCGQKPTISEEEFAEKLCECAKSSAEMVEYLETAEVDNTDSLYIEARKTFKSIKKCVGTTEAEITKDMKPKQAARYAEKVIDIAYEKCPSVAKTLNF